MVIDMLAFLLTMASAHAVNLRSKKIGFRVYSLFHLAGGTLDVLYFSFMCRRGGFKKICSDDESNCKARKMLIGWSAFMFLGILVRLYAILTLWHYDIKWNQTTMPAAPANNSPLPTSQAPSTTSSSTLPSFPSPTPKHSTTSYSLPKIFRGRGGWGRQTARSAVVPTIAISRPSVEEEDELGRLYDTGGDDEEQEKEKQKNKEDQAAYYELEKVLGSGTESESSDDEKEGGMARGSGKGRGYDRV